MRNVLRIENNTPRKLGLPPTQNFPAGVHLIPGLNTVPAGYMAELDAYEVEAHVGGKKITRKPGVDAVNLLLKPVRIVSINGTTFGPQITVFTDDQAGREDGIPSPHDLDNLKLTAAVKFVEATSDVEALKRWQKLDKRPEVKAACLAKLGA